MSDKSKLQTPKQNDDLGWALGAMDLVRNHLIYDGCKETDDPTTCDTKLWNLRAAVVSIKNYQAHSSAIGARVLNVLEDWENISAFDWDEKYGDVQLAAAIRATVALSDGGGA